MTQSMLMKRRPCKQSSCSTSAFAGATWKILPMFLGNEKQTSTFSMPRGRRATAVPPLPVPSPARSSSVILIDVCGPMSDPVPVLRGSVRGSSKLERLGAGAPSAPCKFTWLVFDICCCLQWSASALGATRAANIGASPCECVADWSGSSRLSSSRNATGDGRSPTWDICFILCTCLVSSIQLFNWYTMSYAVPTKSRTQSTPSTHLEKVQYTSTLHSTIRTVLKLFEFLLKYTCKFLLCCSFSNRNAL